MMLSIAAVALWAAQRQRLALWVNALRLVKGGVVAMRSAAPKICACAEMRKPIAAQNVSIWEPPRRIAELVDGFAKLRRYAWPVNVGHDCLVFVIGPWAKGSQLLGSGVGFADSGAGS